MVRSCAATVLPSRLSCKRRIKIQWGHFSIPIFDQSLKTPAGFGWPLDRDRLQVFDAGLGPETIFLRTTLQSLRIVWNCRKGIFRLCGP